MKYKILIKPRPFEHQRLFASHKHKPCSHHEAECTECGNIVHIEPDYIDTFFFQSQTTPETYKAYRKEIREALLLIPDREVIRDGNVSVSYTFVNPDPRSDLDNLCKAIGDSIQDIPKKTKSGKLIRTPDGKKVVEHGALIRNDNQIKENHGSKIVYDKSLPPCVEIEIRRL